MDCERSTGVHRSPRRVGRVLALRPGPRTRARRRNRHLERRRVLPRNAAGLSGARGWAGCLRTTPSKSPSNSRAEPAQTISSTRLHHDPNFGDLTYGDVAGTRKGKRIHSDLSEGDIIGFYTGLQTEYKHRYIIGYFTVEQIDDDPAFHPENAHGRRFQAAGRPKHDDVVIVDGREPGGLLERAYRISEKLDKPPWHRVSTDAVESLNIVDGNVAVARKPPLTLDIEPAEFVEKMPPVR